MIRKLLAIASVVLIVATAAFAMIPAATKTAHYSNFSATATPAIDICCADNTAQPTLVLTALSGGQLDANSTWARIATCCKPEPTVMTPLSRHAAEYDPLAYHLLQAV